MDFLSQDGKGDYIEIQGGVTPTQLQTRPLKAGQSIEWTECISPFAMVAKAAHDPDYSAACGAAGNVIEARISGSALQDMDQFLTSQAGTPVQTLLARGAGWGGLYEKWTGRKISPGLAFEGAVGDEERPWSELLTTGTFSAETLNKPPCSFNISAGWATVLRQSIQAHGATWLHHFHLGIAQLEAGAFEEARAQFNASLALKENAPAHRHLALLHERDGNLDAAQSAYERAWLLCGNDQNLAVEICDFFNRHKRQAAFDTFVKSLPAPVATHERIALMTAQIALERGDYPLVRRLLQQEFCTIREGELSLSELWFVSHIREAASRMGRELTAAEKERLMQQFPPPREIDFRMK